MALLRNRNNIKMKRIFNNFIFISAMLIQGFLTSCSDSFLDLQPYAQSGSADALNSESDLRIALMGTYADLRTVDMYGRTLMVYGDLMADNAFISIKNSGKYLAFDNYLILKDNSDFQNIWAYSYNTILRANNIINSAVAANDNVNQYKGEALAIRALMYFNLVRMYARPYSDDPSSAGVPIVLTYNPSLKPARNTVEEVYAQILSDLDQAYALQTQYSGSARFSKYAARALSAKVYLYMGQYQKALDYANEVINNSGFSLLKGTNLADYWNNPASNSSSVKIETLFEVSADATLNISANELTNIYNQGVAGDLLANEVLYRLYSDQDYRKSLIVPGSRVQGETNAYLVNKYRHYTGDIDDKKVLRMSDMYLIAAEAALRLPAPDEMQSRARLNALMAERDPSLSYTSSGNQLLEDILTERRKELAFEGDRYYDLNRLKRDLVRVGGNYSVRNISFSDYRRIAPIPLSETNANKNIVQNPGYGD